MTKRTWFQTHRICDDVLEGVGFRGRVEVDRPLLGQRVEARLRRRRRLGHGGDAASERRNSFWELILNVFDLVPENA